MAFDIYWDSPERKRLVLEYLQLMTWDEFKGAVKQAHAVCATVSHSVELVIDVKTPMPSGFVLPHFLWASRSQPPHVLRVVVIPEAQDIPAFVEWLAGVVQQTFPNRSKIVFARNLDEARRLPVLEELPLPLE